MATDQDRAFLRETGLGNDPTVIAFLHRAQKAHVQQERELQQLQVENSRLKALLGEPATLRTVTGAGPQGQRQAMTNADLETEVATLWQEHADALTNPFHRLHGPLTRKLERLQRARFEG